MSNMIFVDIKTPTNETVEGTQIPDDYRIQEMIDELVESLELPRFGGNSGRPIEYFMYSLSQNRALPGNATVGECGVRNADILSLQTLQPTELPPPPDTVKVDTTQFYEVVDANASEIAVVLSVLDVNRHETVNLPANRPVGELIRLIVQNYNLAARDNLNQPIKYKLQSKALGRFLEERFSLLEANIPRHDRLTLHREEIAG
jgi:uncharacterized ubiquitin-like protein YukD